MKSLYYASLVLPGIYFGSIITFFIGLVFGFDVTQVTEPHKELIMIFIGSLTALFVLICIAILWLGKYSMELRLQWTGMLILGNMIGVPIFLRHMVRGHLPELRKSKKPVNHSDYLSFGFNQFQTAFWFSMFAASAQYSLFLISGLILHEWEGEMGGYFLFPAIFIFIAMIVCGSILWLFGFKMLRLVSWLIYLIFGRKIVAYESWDKVFCSSLWTLPWAFGIGAIVYVLYFTLNWGGWPDDVIVGTIGNLLGAFCYGTLFCNWYRLIRDAPAFINEEE